MAGEEEEEDMARAEEEGVLSDIVSQDYCFKVIGTMGYFLYRFCLFVTDEEDVAEEDYVAKLEDGA